MYQHKPMRFGSHATSAVLTSPPVLLHHELHTTARLRSAVSLSLVPTNMWRSKASQQLIRLQQQQIIPDAITLPLVLSSGTGVGCRACWRYGQHEKQIKHGRGLAQGGGLLSRRPWIPPRVTCFCMAWLRERTLAARSRAELSTLAGHSLWQNPSHVECTSGLFSIYQRVISKEGANVSNSQ